MPSEDSPTARHITITHTPETGTVARGSLVGATAIFRSTGWLRRKSSWALASSAGRPVRTAFVLGVAARLIAAGFSCELRGIEGHETPAGDDGRETQRHRARLSRRVAALDPVATQARIDSLESRAAINELHAIELDCLHEARATQIASRERLDLAQGSLHRGARVRVASQWGEVQRTNKRWAAVKFDDGTFGRVPYAAIAELADR